MRRKTAYIRLHACIYAYRCTHKNMYTYVYIEKYPLTLVAKSELRSQTYFVVEKWGRAQSVRTCALSEVQQESYKKFELPVEDRKKKLLFGKRDLKP